MIENFISRGYLDEILSKIENDRRISIAGVSGSFSALLTCAVSNYLKKPILIITKDELRAKEISDDISFFSQSALNHFLARDPVFFDIEGAGTEIMHKRLETLQNACAANDGIFISSIDALMLKLPSKESFSDNIINLKTADAYDIEKLAEKLVEIGYIKNDKTVIKGEFSIRGSIVDIFPVNYELPVRIDFFGDEIDTVKNFDPVSQRTVDNIGECDVIQCLEYVVLKDDRDRILEAAQKSKVKMPDKDRERFENGICFPSIDKYLELIYEKPSLLIDYLPENTVVFLENRKGIDQTAKGKILELFKSLENINPVFDIDGIYKKAGKHTIVDLFPLDTAYEKGVHGRNDISYRIKRLNDFREKTSLFFSTVKDLKRKQYKIVILTTGLTHGNRLVDELLAQGIDSGYIELFKRPVQKGEIAILKGTIHESILIDEMKLAILSENIFLPQKKKKKYFKETKDTRIEVFTELKKGDLVVHYSHGIGRYEGIENLQVENIKKDYLKIVYRDGDSIYIPVNQVDLISKYIGSDRKKPKLSKLGGTEWNKTKSRVRSSLKDIAQELISLYSKRENSKGHAFSKDTVWQKEFEEEFNYEETGDQIRSIEEIKRDMENDKPMERLLCGDVGYGKTEVALRAVFKAAIEGKQVAFLVPTTILAQQHYQTFSERLRNYPLTVDVISRFRSKKSQEKILDSLQKGKLDILIGTHRLLSKDTKFRQLGLLVIDEEQRFGVEHKEQIKKLFPKVDVLTLSATPIPRTLHMSLSGIRDISIIEKPPEERYPVQTYVFEYNDEIIKAAIRRELGRGGQVFYLSNRVRNIESKSAKIRKLIGTAADIGIAHGQMNETRLENTLSEFLKGEYDILVCTTIIESGIDMPNVNTIIVEDSDRMGLAQLYQLRGRVGRSNRQAYAYITTKRGKSITETAEKRLEAIREFTEFGAGFKIAMRDMEIRGAGDILGGRQHGQLDTVGYDMYCKLLGEAVMEIKGEFIEKDIVETIVDLRVNAYISDSYIGIEPQKIEIYKKIALIADDNDILEIEDELLDRFGEIPKETYNLMKIAYIKNIASRYGIVNVTERNDGCILEYSREIGINPELFKNLYEKYRRNLLINMGMKPHLFLKLRAGGTENIDSIKSLLGDIKRFGEN